MRKFATPGLFSAKKGKGRDASCASCTLLSHTTTSVHVDISSRYDRRMAFLPCNSVFKMGKSGLRGCDQMSSSLDSLKHISNTSLWPEAVFVFKPVSLLFFLLLDCITGTDEGGGTMIMDVVACSHKAFVQILISKREAHGVR